ncbi:Vacuolar protein-sorting-associated protein 25 [Operophtera brumata]|uniref:Inositol-pentakisphosphate 2-kinase n=1 Tax=Operophtera brumata TaxID=104452 RepID=A0A0L7L8D5_OPEBR|nr:Vacuolar protein-sorting-associated protein 25 [Operophtera brumata]
MKLMGKDWGYINEGNAHIVLQLKHTEYVLRIIKDGTKISDFESVQKSVNFVNFVMYPLLCNSKCVQEVINIPLKELDELRKVLHTVRPENRRIKSVLSKYAIQTLNLTILSPKCPTNYCIEIKPKEGFLASRLKPLSKCYYCLKQYLKLEKSHIEEKSSYCPLDLFSGNKERMKLALMNLIDNPQNNLKLFDNGQVIYHANSTKNDFTEIIRRIDIFHSIMQFLEFIIEILLKDIKKDNDCFEDISRGAGYYPLKVKDECITKTDRDQKRFHNSFLYKLLQIQKLSDNINIDVKAIEDEGMEYVETLVNQVQAQNLNLNVDQHREWFLKSIDPVHAALLSAIAKDCSIMICFSPNFLEEFSYIQLGTKKISYRLSVTDLEPKKIKSLLKRKETESRMIDICKNIQSQFLFRIQPHTETRAKQLEAWEQLITEYLKNNKLSTIDIRESQNSPLFNNVSINRKLSQESILTILEDMARSGKAAPVDKSRTVWEVYWHSLDEWGNMMYNWASGNGMTNSVCTLFELREGDNTSEEEFHGLDMNVLVKALKALEAKGKCELMEFDDSQGVKFF